ncbi:MAG TPA: hypothetical protein VLJ15_09235 [Gammaproteobacteria bacterium]|nr:hypothetical protein [Gammaproteobacteria bacterium]
MLSAHALTPPPEKLEQLKKALRQCTTGKYSDPEEQKKSEAVSAILDNKAIRTESEFLEQIGKECYYYQQLRYYVNTTLYKQIDDAFCHYFDISETDIACAMMDHFRLAQSRNRHQTEFVKSLNMARGDLILARLPPQKEPDLRDKLILFLIDFRQPGTKTGYNPTEVNPLLEKILAEPDEQKLFLMLATLLNDKRKSVLTHTGSYLCQWLGKSLCDYLKITEKELDLVHYEKSKPALIENGSLWNYDQIRHEARLDLINKARIKRLANAENPPRDESKNEPLKDNIKQLQATLNHYLTDFIEKEKTRLQGSTHKTFLPDSPEIQSATALLTTINNLKNPSKSLTENQLLRTLYNSYYCSKAREYPGDQNRVLQTLDDALFRYFNFSDDDLSIAAMDFVIAKWNSQTSNFDFPKDMRWTKTVLVREYLYHNFQGSSQKVFRVTPQSNWQTPLLMQDIGPSQKESLQTRLVNYITEYKNSGSGGKEGLGRAGRLLATVTQEEDEAKLFEIIMAALNDYNQGSLLESSTQLRAAVGKALCCHFGMTERTVSLEQFKEHRELIEKNQYMNPHGTRNTTVYRLVKEAQQIRLAAEAPVVVHATSMRLS